MKLTSKQKLKDLSVKEKKLLLKQLKESNVNPQSTIIDAEQSVFKISKNNIVFEERSLLYLIAANKIPKIQTATLAYLPDKFLNSSSFNKEDFIRKHLGGLPFLFNVLNTSLGRVGIIVLPIFESDLYQIPDLLYSLIIDGLYTASTVGAKIVSLAGILPSATNYGKKIIEKIQKHKSLPQISTGHATTVASINLQIRKILRKSNREITNEILGFLGLGSIGISTLNTILKCFEHPKKIIFCDVPSMKNDLQLLKEIILKKHLYNGNIQIVESTKKAHPGFYESTLIIGATNASNVLEINKLKSGTIIIDDSAPHCFDEQEAFERLNNSKDIIFTEGGMIECPDVITEIRSASQFILSVKDNIPGILWNRNVYEITSCILSGLLSHSHPELTSTTGFIDCSASIQHYKKLQELGFKGSGMHLNGVQLPPTYIEEFIKRFGG